MSLAEGYKRNYKKGKGNQYFNHNMAGDYNTVPVLYFDMDTNTVTYYKCIHVPNLYIFRAATARLGKYSIGGYGQIGVCRFTMVTHVLFICNRDIIMYLWATKACNKGIPLIWHTLLQTPPPPTNPNHQKVMARLQVSDRTPHKMDPLATIPIKPLLKSQGQKQKEKQQHRENTQRHSSVISIAPLNSYFLLNTSKNVLQLSQRHQGAKKDENNPKGISQTIKSAQGQRDLFFLFTKSQLRQLVCYRVSVVSLRAWGPHFHLQGLVVRANLIGWPEGLTPK